MWRNKKGRIRRIWKALGVLLILLYFLPLATRLIPFGMDRKETLDFFSKQKIVYTDSSIYIGDQKVRFVAVGPDTGRMVVLVHGSPGTWSDLKNYMTDPVLIEHFRVLAFDRPGYGESGGPGYARLKDQAGVVASLIGGRRNKAPVLVVGHSYGGPVALKLATMFPEEIGGMLLVSPTVSPKVEEGIAVKRWAQKYSRLWAFSWMMDDMLRHSTNEMSPLPDEVRSMEADYIKITCPVTELHGTRDWMAPFANQQYICSNLVCTRVDTFAVPDGDHFLIWSMQDKVVNLLLDLAKKSRRAEYQTKGLL